MARTKKYMMAAWAALAMTACNEIDLDDRLIDTELKDLQQTVLMEEFTGQNCPNCPAGAQTAHSLQELFGRKVVVMGIHAGGFAAGSEFQTEAGTAYWNHFYADGDGIGYPAAMFNRGGKVSTGYQSEWRSLVIEGGLVAPTHSLTLQAQYDPLTREVRAEATVGKRSEADGTPTKLLFMLTESKIVNYQINGSKFEPEYEHNHVLRGAIGDRDANPNFWGDDVALTAGEDVAVQSAAYRLDDAWKAENMQVVGVLYDAQTYRVLAADEVAIVE